MCDDILLAAMISAVDWATASMIGSSTSAGSPYEARSVFMAMIRSKAVTPPDWASALDGAPLATRPVERVRPAAGSAPATSGVRNFVALGNYNG